MSEYNDEQGFAWSNTLEFRGSNCPACGDSGVRRINDNGLVVDITCECSPGATKRRGDTEPGAAQINDTTGPGASA